MKFKEELKKTFEYRPESKIKANQFHKIEASLNNVFFKKFELGVMLSFFFDQTYNGSFNFNFFYHLKILFSILLKSLFNREKIKDLNKKIIYFNRGKYRHYSKMTNSFNCDKKIRKDTLIIGSLIYGDKKSIFFYCNLVDFLRVVYFVLANCRVILNKISILELSIRKRIIFFIFLIYQILKTISIDKFIKKQSKLMLIGSDADRGYNSSLFFAVGRSYNIKTFTFQHGVMNGYFGIFPLNADEVWVWGNMAYQQYQLMGLDVSRIKITGSPIIEKITIDKNIKIAVKKNYSLNSGKTICLALSNPSKEDDLKLVSFFYEIKKRYGAAEDNFLVKIHPARDPSSYSWIKDEFNIEVLHQKIKYDDFMIFTDVLLTHSSGIATESIYYNKKIGILDILDRSAGNGKMLNLFYGIPLLKKESEFMKLMKNNIKINPEEIYYKTGDFASLEICKNLSRKISTYDYD